MRISSFDRDRLTSSLFGMQQGRSVVLFSTCLGFLWVFLMAPKFCIFSFPLLLVAGLGELLQTNILKSLKMSVIFMFLSFSCRLLLSHSRLMG